MTRFLVFIVLLVAAASTAQAQNAPPDLKGKWTGKGKSLIFGANPHHPGDQTTTQPPRVRDSEFTYVIDGQEGRLVWGHVSSKQADTREPFAWALSADNKTIIGSDTDGYMFITLLGPDRMESCYAHNGLSPSKSIVATCLTFTKDKK